MLLFVNNATQDQKQASQHRGASSQGSGVDKEKLSEADICDKFITLAIQQTDGTPTTEPMSTFDSTTCLLPEILGEIVKGKIQSPDFLRDWLWDDDLIRSLLASTGLLFSVF